MKFKKNLLSIILTVVIVSAGVDAQAFTFKKKTYEKED